MKIDALRIDHIVYAAPDLEAAIDDLEQRLGVRASKGGSHVGLGTRNALISFKDESYLELIGPDEKQDEPSSPRPFGIDSLSAARLVAWAAKESDLEKRIEIARAGDFEVGRVLSMSRVTPSGERLEWRLTIRATPGGEGLVPFLIDWGNSPHPSSGAAKGCHLIGLRGEHPDPGSVDLQLTVLGASLPVSKADEVALVATLDTPRGRVELR